MNEIEKINPIRLESVIFELECGLNALDAVHTAMEEGSDEPENYVNALYCVHGYLEERKRTLKDAFTKAIKAAKVEQKAVQA